MKSENKTIAYFNNKVYAIKKVISVAVTKVSTHVVHTVRTELLKHKKFQRYYSKQIKYKVPLFKGAEVGKTIKIGYVGRLLSPTISHIPLLSR